MGRKAEVIRQTKETDIQVKIELDGVGQSSIATGVGFFDHMLEGFSKHGFFDLDVKVKGDLHVDSHHTVEDTGIVLGQAIAQALGEKKGIKRYGNFLLPMDETLVLCAIDLGGRPYFNFDIDFSTEKIGEFDTELIREFFYAVSYTSKMNLHFKLLSGGNSHHIAEAIFKAFAKALDEASSYDQRVNGILSTKGSL